MNFPNWIDQQFTVCGSDFARINETRDIGAKWTTAFGARWHQIHGLWYSEGKYIHDSCDANRNYWFLIFPQGSFIYSSLHACHQDERVFKNANEFKPERFLTDDGKFAVKLDKSLPFGAGKRLCAGETFARNAYFLVTTALIQNFVFKVPANEKMPGVDETITGVLRKLPDYWLHVESRWTSAIYNRFVKRKMKEVSCDQRMKQFKVAGKVIKNYGRGQRRSD